MARASPPFRPLRILDLGSGGGDTLVRIARWAAVRRLPVHLTGVDLNPQSALLARETELRRTSRKPSPASAHSASSGSLQMPSPSPRTRPPDLIVSSLFFHHLEDVDIVRVLRWQHRTARLGWFVNDLVRSRRAARAFTLVARLLHSHPFVQHDGPVSFRRALRPAEWPSLLRRAQIPLDTVTLLPTRPARPLPRAPRLTPSALQANAPHTFQRAHTAPQHRQEHS